MHESLPVEEVMRRDFVGVTESDSVGGAAELMHEEQSDGAVVLRGRDPVGMVTASDILSVVAQDQDPTETQVDEIMRHPVVTVQPDDDLSEVVGVLTDRDVRWLAVVSPEGVVGTVSERDIVIGTMALTPTGSVDTPDPEAPIESGSDIGLQSETYSTQGVCEICGSLSRNLAAQNGQMLCEDCLAM